MVIFQAPGGNPGYNQFDSLESAVEFVEQLRNDRDVTNARIFALEEVKFEMRPYFKVELQALNSGAPAAQRSTVAAPSPEQSSAPIAPVAAAPAPSAPLAGSAPTAAAPVTPAPAAPVPPVSAPNPAPSAPAPGEGMSDDDGQPTRRGLFGR